MWARNTSLNLLSTLPALASSSHPNSSTKLKLNLPHNSSGLVLSWIYPPLICKSHPTEDPWSSYEGSSPPLFRNLARIAASTYDKTNLSVCWSHSTTNTTQVLSEHLQVAVDSPGFDQVIHSLPILISRYPTPPSKDHSTWTTPTLHPYHFTPPLGLSDLDAPRISAKLSPAWTNVEAV